MHINLHFRSFFRTFATNNDRLPYSMSLQELSNEVNAKLKNLVNGGNELNKKIAEIIRELDN